MGKKDTKKGGEEKKLQKQARVALKQQKAELKRAKKDAKENGEIDVEAAIAQFNERETKRTAVSVTICPQPSRRVNCSMTVLPNNEVLMFGGEYCDGNHTMVFNELYRWNLERNEWKHIESINTPPPRCSHQSVAYQDKLYVVGGEYGTLDQFHHYKDLWELDVRTSIWTELKPTGDVPSARSGHRMILWRNCMVLFGGFYEVAKDSRWYNDLYFYSFPENRWYNIPQKPFAPHPKPRSGHLMFVHEENIYIFGGYCKEKASGAKSEAVIYQDMWVLDLKPAFTGVKGALDSQFDFSKLSWQRVARKGDIPSPRCGSVTAVHRNKLLMFGGVDDIEGPRHTLVSTFYNDIFVFDMEKLRWYKLQMKKQKEMTKAEKSVQETDNSASLIEKNTVFIAPEISEEPLDVELLEKDEDATDLVEDIADEFKVVTSISDSHMDQIEAGKLETESVAPKGARSLTDFVTDLGVTSEPCPRMNPCILLRGNTLLVYGGNTEFNDVEITLDDCWALDLNKREFWRKLLPGSMQHLNLQAYQDENSTSTNDEDGDDAEDDEEIESDGEQSDVEDTKEDTSASFKVTKSEETISPEPCPQRNETLRDFYNRTSKFWTEKVQKEIGESGDNSQKEIKRRSFALAESCYNSFAPK